MKSPVSFAIIADLHFGACRRNGLRLAETAATEKGLSLVVMDPLAAPLSCPVRPGLRSTALRKASRVFDRTAWPPRARDVCRIVQQCFGQRRL